ncbi:netrin receptor UNC5A-like isoform X2 [Orbicella faveolata]|uniref:netrin receptor UNC5A-like isoform X2 n=1 Tax=Orbicella faveolata TaxID=48498 RepID=UPI0009E20968|nr:netrin receptor UNC5A-like isoform X2 [Orbicella faveolata]
MSSMWCWICLLFFLALVNMEIITINKGKRQAKVLLSSELHYLAKQCTEEKHAFVASDSVERFTKLLGTIGGCDGSEKCAIENVQVECEERSVTLRRTDIVGIKQASKVPVTVKFALRVPLPSNTSVVSLNQTTQQVSSNILASLNETDLTLNISGVVLEYDPSKPPVVRIVGLVCDKGQLPKGTKCETRKTAMSNQVKRVSGTVAGLLTLIVIIIALIVLVFVRKHYLRDKRMTSDPVISSRSPLLSLEMSETLVQIQNERDRDSPNCKNETLHSHLPTSVPKYITKSEATFTSTGGELSEPLDSDVRIIVPRGAIPAGISQHVFFGVFSDETALMQDFSEAPDKTLISPVVECGPHDIHLSKPVEIIVPHCLCLREARKESITVYRCGNFSAEFEGRLSWERVPSKSEKNSQSRSWFTVGEDSIRIKTKTFSLWSIFACGGPRRKRATVFSSRPDPKSDLIYLRFYVYSDNEDSKKHVELKDRERFPDSKLAREQPFRMYSDSKVITVKLTNLEEGWKFDKTNDMQIYHYEKGSRNGFRTNNACDFAVKPEDGRDVDGFSCIVKFQQEGHIQEYSIYLNPGFTPLKRQNIRRKPAAGGLIVTASNNTRAIAGCSTSTGPKEEDDDCDSHNQEGRSSPDSSRENRYVLCDHFFTSLGLSDGKPVTENLLWDISPYVGVKWKLVLRKLSIKEAIIRNLYEDYKNASVDEKCYQGLLVWKDGQGPEGATIKTLCDALRLAGCSEAMKALRENALQDTDC